ncbi:hypothetical protein, partial [Klebsiella pneumoniae]|uniref:hypothetical protein n=1 Tax=Klebsiella pneumoniae TaxID=573 RepID=UPI001C6A09FF
FGLSENTDDLFVGKTLLHGVVLMWLMKTLLTSRCINQRGAGQVAWQHILLNGHYTFQSSNEIIDLDALVTGLKLR